MSISTNHSTSRDSTSHTILWAFPRTVSTALAKCLSFIDGIEVWFEPYTYSQVAMIEYKFQTQADLPMEYDGNEEAFEKVKHRLDFITKGNVAAERLPYASVKRSLENTTARHAFVKDMGFAVNEGLVQYLPKGYKHTFIIRNPLRILFSYRKSTINMYVSMGEVKDDSAEEKVFDLERDDRIFKPGCFVKELYDLWVYVKENIDSDPVVIDADDLLTKPKETLSAYCAAVGLPYDDGLLQWDASTDCFKKMKASGDDVLLTFVAFYDTAMTSSQFLPPSKPPSRDEITPDVIRCSERVMKYYDEMYEARLKISPK